MKSAKEMFEELGYEYEESYDGRLIDYYKKHNNLDLELLFNKEKETFCMTYVVDVDIKLLEAINKQVEELHWNDTTVDIDVKLDGKNVIEAMRGGNNGL